MTVSGGSGWIAKEPENERMLGAEVGAYGEPPSWATDFPCDCHVTVGGFMPPFHAATAHL